MAFSLIDLLYELGERTTSREDLDGLRLTPNEVLRAAADLVRRDGDAIAHRLETAREKLAALLARTEAAALLEEIYSHSLSLSVSSYRQGCLDGYLLSCEE
ncbi:MAG: hypothetical protein H5U01_07740 [Clostridia bacterium]|nr:hypothetical protein [Clostridia bacterium]